MNISQRQNRRQQQTINKLKKALINLILEDNTINEITVSEIAGRADLNRGTFYIHYTDKRNLIEDLFSDAIGGVQRALQIPYKNKEKIVLEGVVPSTRLIFEHIENNKSLFKALYLIQETPNLFERLEEMMLKLTKEEVHFEIESVSSEIEYDIFISYQISATIGVIKHWIKTDFEYTAQFMCEQLTTIYSHRIIAMHIKNNK